MTVKAKRLGRWPNLFIAGVPKAGTRSLSKALAAHGDVFVPAQDEPRFFLEGVDKRMRRLSNIVEDKEEYLRLYRNGERTRYRCDGTVDYLFSNRTMQRIWEAEPDAKVIVILRDPVDRAYSHYLNDVREGIENRSFMTAIQQQLSGVDEQPWPSRYLCYGHYAQPLQNAAAIFGQNLHVLFFEDLTADPATSLAKIGNFLSLAADPDFPPTLPHANPAAMPRNKAAGRLLASPSFRRAARAVSPRRARPWFRRAFISRSSVPAIDPAVHALLVQEYASVADEVTQVLQRRPPWRNFGTV